MNRIKKDTSVHQEPNPVHRENREHPAWDEEEHVSLLSCSSCFGINLLFTGVEYQIVKILLGLKKIAFMNTHLFSCPSCKSEQDLQDEAGLAREDTMNRIKKPQASASFLDIRFLQSREQVLSILLNPVHPAPIFKMNRIRGYHCDSVFS